MKSTPYPLITDPNTHRENIRQKAIESLKSVFPFVGKKYTVDIKDVQVHDTHITPEDHKRAILQARSLVEPIRATLQLKDNETGKVVQEQSKFNLLQLPYFTDHNTFVLGGSTYSVSNQLRMKPGVYTRKRKNEELEAGFNLSHGANFRLSMDPEKGHFKVEYQSTAIPLYPILNKLGVSDETLAKYWNKDLVNLNREAFEKNADKHIEKLYQRLVPEYAQVKDEDRVKAIKSVLDVTKMDPEINQRTLGKPFDKVSPEALMEASGKLLKAYNQEADFDERDSLAFKKLMTVDDFISERIGLEARNLRRKALMKLGRKGVELEKVIPHSPFTRSVHRFLISSQLSGNPDQINPMEMMDAASRITSLGEGGIENERAISPEVRRLHTSHAGFLDPVRSPENERAGVDTRATLFAAKDREGDMYYYLQNVKTGKHEHVRVMDAVNKTIAFAKQPSTGTVDVIKDNRVTFAPAAEVDYRFPTQLGMYSPSAAMLPFVDSMDGNRATLASKHQTQALPLEHAEPPLIQNLAGFEHPGQTFEELAAHALVPRAPVSGKVTKIQGGVVYIKPSGKHGEKTSAAEEKTVSVFENFPLAAKTYIDHKLRVKVGDTVKEGDPIADTTFVRDGKLSLGRNLLTAYVPWRGMNSNDAVVVSESGAKKLTSLHMYTEGLDIDTDMAKGREQHRTYFGNKFEGATYKKLDDDGVIKPGTTVEKGELLIAALRKSALSPEAAMLGKLHKSLVKPFRDAALLWEHDTPGEVVDVFKTGNKIRMTVKTKAPLRIGDKVSGRWGNKGVVSTIVPDEQMLRTQDGRIIDLAMTPAGVVSRVNPGQIMETALAKVAEKIGKPIAVENFVDRSNVDWVKEQLKKHGVKDKEDLTDPMTGKKLKNILVGPHYILKLSKSTDTNYAARGIEDYDVNQQPSGGGPKGAKALGMMEVNALLAHGATNILREAASLKSQKNDEYWRAFQLGLPSPEPKTTFAYDRFGAMLTGAGIKINKKGNYVRLAPLTDREIDAMATHSISEAKFVRAKDLKPELHGFFDPVATGGLSGTKWSRVDLQEPIVNPVFEKPVRSLLDMTGAEFDTAVREEGGAGIRKRLEEVDVKAREKELRKSVDGLKGAKRDDAIKQLKYIEGLKKSELKPHEAYVLSKIPVVPPIYRPLTPGKGGDFQITGANHLYRDILLSNDALKSSEKLPKEDQESARTHLYDAAKALFGLGDAVSPQAAARDTRGFLAEISGAGRTPKASYFQSKLLARKQDISGRATIVPDATLALDEVGLPEEMAWSMYKPFILRRMVQRGFGATDAKNKVDEKHPTAKDFLLEEIKDRPVLLNRAPSLRRYNVLAAYPKLVPGKTIRIHELFAPIQAGDFDGDTMQVHVPVNRDAVAEAKEITLPKMLLGDQYKQQTLVVPIHESIMGVYRATGASSGGKTHTFKSKADAQEAYHRGEIELTTPVEIKK